MLSVAMIQHFASRILDDLIEQSTDVGRFWEQLKVVVRLNPHYALVDVGLTGTRIRDAGSGKAWRCLARLKDHDAPSHQFLKEQIQKMYGWMRDHESCDCDWDEISWHQDGDGDLIVPKFVQHVCERHAERKETPHA